MYIYIYIHNIVEHYVANPYNSYQSRSYHPDILSTLQFPKLKRRIQKESGDSPLPWCTDARWACEQRAAFLGQLWIRWSPRATNSSWWWNLKSRESRMFRKQASRDKVMKPTQFTTISSGCGCQTFLLCGELDLHSAMFLEWLFVKALPSCNVAWQWRFSRKSRSWSCSKPGQASLLNKMP